MLPEPHDCLEHLRYRHHSWVETHGLDAGPFEHCWEEWWECRVCGDKFTAGELEEMANER